ncbi:MAG TPA: 6-carboxytetrahydropterin synthase [Bryobacteraceae bacterium]|nr:6-carboxytetrahydropterin synthase [Bryobacteraceae bacterium]
MRLTRRYRFSAAHRLDSPHFSPQENRALYGKCNNPYGHGHNYILDVTVRGPLDATGRVVDVQALDKLIHESVLTRLDQKNLNADLPEFASVVPTTENIASHIQRLVERSWKNVFTSPELAVDRIRIEETEHNFFELHSL